MAPFKLKFRMGSSRSTSQEHEPDPQVNEALLNHQTNATIGASSSTIDSVDCNSLVSLNTSERKLLLPNKGNSMRMGFINQNQTIQGESIPDTPPPTYEHVLEEQRQLSIAGILSNNDPLLHLNELEHLSLNELPCNDPNCQENYNSLSSNGNAATTINNQHPNTNIVNNNEISITITHANNHHDSLNLNNEHLANEDTEEDNTNTIEDDRKESIDSQEFLLGDTMTDAASDQERRREHQQQQQQQHQQQQQQQLQQHQQLQQQQQMIDNQSCSGNCQQYGADGSASCSGMAITQGAHNQNNDFYDPLMNHGVYCNDASHYNDDYHNHQQIYEDDGSECPGNTGECLGDSGECTCNAGGDDNACNDAHSQWVDMQQQQHQQQQQQHSSGSHQSLHCDSDDQELQQNPYEQQYQHQLQQQQYFQQQLERSLTPEIISNKSSKEIYKDLAKQCGITCKMSDGCRCMECQSHYFDCEYDDVGGDLNLNEHQKTDGGLGAGTPMFITEVMHGSACNIL